MKKTAIYGGAFDPVHKAHLAVANAVLRAERVDQVVFVPAASSPLKKRGPYASDGQRLEMLQLALKNEARLLVDDYELRKGGVSYTIETVKAYRERRADEALFLILGADQFRQLDRWFQIAELVRLVHFLVLARPGFDLSVPGVRGLDWTPVDAPELDISSTLIRGDLAAGRAVHPYLPEAVETFIRRNGLYR